MASTILLKRGSGVPPANKLTPGELAVDKSSGKVYTKTTGGAVVEVGGGGGGGGMGLKLATQPTTAGDFTKPSVISTAPSISVKEVLQYRSSQSFGTSDTSPVAMTFTVPAGMNFIFFGLGVHTTNPSNSLGLYLGSIVIDGETIYPMYPASGNMPGSSFHSIDNKDQMWPFGQDAGNGHGVSAHDGILIETSMSFSARYSGGGSGANAAIHGFFIKA